MMPEEIKFEISELTKPADTLIKKIAKGVGALFEPGQIRRMANAEAEAAIIKTRADIKISGLQRRAVHRFVEEEARHQANMESITARAIPLLEAGADAEKVHDDWIADFFSNSRKVSNEHMQELWARILAGEANNPGQFSRRTMNQLANMDSAEAEKFQNLCVFVWDIEGPVPWIANLHEDVYVRAGITTEYLEELQNIGLVRFSSDERFARRSPEGQVVEARYGSFRYRLVDPYGGFYFSHVLFTKTGAELSRVCSGYNDEFRKGIEAAFLDYLQPICDQ